MFADDENSVLKWCLNRPEQSKNTTALKELASTSTSQNVYKQLRPSYILKVERLVTETVRVLEEEYFNPFAETNESALLYNLSSGIPLPNDITGEILNVYSEGAKQMNEFKKHFIQTDATQPTTNQESFNTPKGPEQDEKESKKGKARQQAKDNKKEKKSSKSSDRHKPTVTKRKMFYDPISRNNIKSFKCTSATQVVKSKDNKTTTVTVNRDIIGSLLSFTMKNEKPIDWESALAYPLSPVPLSICSADGVRRKVVKSKLMEVIFAEQKIKVEDPKNVSIQKAESTLIIDLMAALRSFRPLPETYEELFWNLLSTFPKHYYRVDIVADTYRSVSIKGGEREKRGCSERIIVKSAKSKMPREFITFLQNGDNKTLLINLMCQYVMENSQQVCSLMKCCRKSSLTQPCRQTRKKLIQR